MTKLEEEMFLEIHGFLPAEDSHLTDPLVIEALRNEAKAAAEVAKKWIIRSLVDLQAAYKYRHPYPDTIETWENWYFRCLGVDAWPEYTHPDIQEDIIKYKEECLQRLKDDIRASKKQVKKLRKG